MIAFRASSISPTVVAAALVCVAATLMSPAAAQLPGERLDAAERQRLRGDLRQRAQDERQQAGRDSIRPGAPATAPGWQPAPPAGYAAPGGHASPGGYASPVGDGGPRLSPEERQQLRRQLRDVRLRGPGPTTPP